MKRKPLAKLDANSKDVVPTKKARGRDPRKNISETLPKILSIAASSGSLQVQRVRCGKANCKCARGELHAAHYLYVWDSTRPFKLYVRRGDVAAVAAAISRRRSTAAALNAESAKLRNLLRDLKHILKGVDL